MEKDVKELLETRIEHFNIREFDSTGLVNQFKKMSFSAGSIARACDIYDRMLAEKEAVIILCLAGSSSSAGCMHIYRDLVKCKAVDAVVATGASVIDMDVFEHLGFSHYRQNAALRSASDSELKELGIDRIYDTYINESELKQCDEWVWRLADSLPARPYSSREMLRLMGQKLLEEHKERESLVSVCAEMNVPIFCPAFTDSSAGFGFVKHQVECAAEAVTIDSIKDFRELTAIKINSPATGLFMVGGGVPKNFAQDVVVSADFLGYEVDMHKYAIQITVADVRDGGCSSSTLSEATSWGKVTGTDTDQCMVFSEATLAVPIIASYVYHSLRPQEWRKPRNATDRCVLA